MRVVNLLQKFSEFDAHWDQRIAAEVNDCYVKLVKFQGEFIWHSHEVEDELFYVVRGRLLMKLRDGERWVEEGEFIVIPHGTEHCPVAPEEVWIMLFEPKATVARGSEATAPQGELQWI